MSLASPRRLHRAAQQRFCIRKREDPEGSETSHYDRGKRQRDDQRLTGPGQIFRVAMYHENHPDGSYEMCNWSSRSSRHGSFRGSWVIGELPG
jgi:hypothetical protein